MSLERPLTRGFLLPPGNTRNPVAGRQATHPIQNNREETVKTHVLLALAGLATRARLVRWVLSIMLGLGCSVSLAQIEPDAGTWKTWVLASGDRLRLPPPPDEAATRAEIAQLKEIAKQRDAGTLERIIWWNAGPPGYRWTSIAIPPGQASATLHSRIMALLSVAIYDATVAAWDSKYAYNRPRPTAFDPSLTAALQNPQSPSYPSEHAVVAGAASTVLAYLFPDKADDFKARAEEAVQVWVQAGLHYPSDVKAGLELGRAVGALIVEWAKPDRVGAVDIPPGPCRWTGINPVAPFTGARKTWVLSSGSQLRPGPPPDYRSFSDGKPQHRDERRWRSRVQCATVDDVRSLCLLAPAVCRCCFRCLNSLNSRRDFIPCGKL
jgi:membrane-associated phospholipid phosphatase